MKNLYIKLHPNKIGWLTTHYEYGIINVDQDLCVTITNMEEVLKDILDDVGAVYVEKPFLKLQGDNPRLLAKMIIKVQRHFGALLYALKTKATKQLSSKTIEKSVYKDTVITMDMKFTETLAVLKGDTSKYTPLELLVLHDVLLLEAFIDG